jgi:hypothetical protein
MVPEVLIYIQNLKKYFQSNEDQLKYFVSIDNKESFFDYVINISQKNFKNKGEPELTVDQFEEFKKITSGVNEKTRESTAVFMYLGEFGFVSLN